MIPATFASEVTCPSATCITSATTSSSLTSPVKVTRRSEATSTESAARRGSLMSVATTVAPSASSRTAVARPIPEPAPVTMTRAPENRPSTMCVDIRGARQAFDPTVIGTFVGAGSGANGTSIFSTPFSNVAAIFDWSVCCGSMIRR